MSVIRHAKPLSLKKAKEAGLTVRFVVQRYPKTRGYIVTDWLRLHLTKDQVRPHPPAVDHGSKLIDVVHRHVRASRKDDAYTYRTVPLNSNKTNKKERKRKQRKERNQTQTALHYRWPLSRLFASHYRYRTQSHDQSQKHAVFQDMRTPVEALAKLPRTILSRLKDRFLPNFSVAPSSHESSPTS